MRKDVETAGVSTNWMINLASPFDSAQGDVSQSL